jgi:hypothetical protein
MTHRIITTEFLSLNFTQLAHQESVNLLALLQTSITLRHA